MTLLQDLPLNGFDIEARKFVLEQYKLRGIKYHGLSSPSKITKEANGKLTVTVDPYKREGDSVTIDNVDQVGLSSALSFLQHDCTTIRLNHLACHSSRGTGLSYNHPQRACMRRFCLQLGGSQGQRTLDSRTLE